jgi:hypothetical protein
MSSSWPAFLYALIRKCRSLDLNPRGPGFPSGMCTVSKLIELRSRRLDFAHPVPSELSWWGDATLLRFQELPQEWQN